MGIQTKRVRLIAFFSAAVLLCAPLPTLAAAKTAAQIEAEIKQQEREYQKIQSQMSKVNKNIKETQRKEKNVTQQIGILSQKITVTQQKVNVVSLKMRKVQNNIFTLSNNIKEANKNISAAQEILKKRLVNIYKYGGVAEFNLLLSSQGAEDALANSYLLGKIAEQDQKLINDLIEQKRRLTMTQEELRREHLRLKGQTNELKQQNKELKSAADERNELLAKVRRDKKLFMAEQAELQRASQEMQSAIKRLLAEKKRLRDEANRKQGKPVTPTPNYYKGGRLAWPIQGTITSQFGTRVHPVFKTKITHTGLDIAAPKGTPVKAADPGEVLYTGWMRGYGQVVIVDHGGNLTTVYAHLSKIETTEDAKVTRQTVIGRVGSTGVATGNHLHFEVRVNGNAVNPLKYLNK
ncbi:murein hydrolase activator EnvC family protein [Cloacibacillus porcorum]|uniref:murein hydrolase activator EnvC family protein n=1 Tax=Cloacibacillus porcorum TaxID=1197717 RepID=UPI00267335B4|nr:peptidoglycan DD-metalloendopeptidase family protein [Cloacibacillus porcorum]MCD8391617.1 peptidoglycan DD-metalloendopeptidase family protein [Cloacibacillus porcorum]